MDANLKSTVLKAEHESLGARMVPFAGWYMPVQYKGVREEHLCVREAVGLFDVSHMGEIRFRGPQALSSLEWLTTNDVAKLGAGEAQYSLLPNAQGGLVDDIIVYCVKPGEDYLVCVNAANIEKDFAHMVANNKGAEIVNESSQWSQIAIQGPKARDLVKRVLHFDFHELGTFCFGAREYRGEKALVARTGYTGEDGVEVFISNANAIALWRELLEKGADLGVQPIGLGARDTLRTEMKYSLYGHEINDVLNPFAAGLGWVIKPQKKDFLGRGTMMDQKEKGLPQKLIGFVLEDKGIPREGYEVFSFDNRKIGKVTSGTMSPSLQLSIGIAYVDAEFAHEGAEFKVDIRGRGAKAKVVKTPFVKPKGA